LVAFFNRGLGLIFGAIMARKVGEHALKNSISINYQLVGAEGYVVLMVWHGGMSGSAPLDAADQSKSLRAMIGNSTLNKFPDYINTNETIFSWWNLTIFAVILIVIPTFLYLMSKRIKTKEFSLPNYKFDTDTEAVSGAEKLDHSKLLAWFFGLMALVILIIKYGEQLSQLNITLPSLNFFMFALAIILHGKFSSFLKALEEAIKGTSGILIQFPLYFGIMGIMNHTGMVGQISDFFVSIANETTMPIFTFFSAGLVNIFVPSGGGQWAVQGPIVLEAALKLNVPLPKAIMALAYGDQITNMLQPFWALPLLGITKLKAKEILPYTLLLMLVGSAIYIIGLLVF
ncbi:MAG: short-chain fatty acid transporter, partial [Flavobacteriaceae bacterium]|nr:short-chain fatty acid transporter [Flavobacteriaceae bacterium]